MITLSTKDADYIANCCREFIQMNQESYEQSVKERKALYELAQKIKPNDKDLLAAYETGVKGINDAYKEIMGKYTKILELMYTGSNNE